MKGIKDLKCGFVNICGLRSKLKSPDFEEYLHTKDILAIAETKLDRYDKIDLPGYKIYRSDRKNARRPSGGVAVLVRNEICKYVKFIETDLDFLLYFVIEKALIGTDQDVLCCVVYIPPENSDYSNINMFEAMEEDFINVHNDEFVCFMGDFNARTKDLSDLLGMDADILDSLELDDHLKEKILEENILDELGFSLNRNSQDNTVNNYGYRILELCKNTGVCMLNGRISKDCMGNTTCDNKSVVDYIMCSPKLFPFVSKFEVDVFNGNLSDKHNALSLSLNVIDEKLVNPDIQEQTNSSNFSVKWLPKNVQDFVKNIDKDNITSALRLMSEMHADDVDQIVMDELVKNVECVFTDSAKKIGVMKTKCHKQRKRETVNKPWYNNECEFKRNVYLTARDRYARTKTLEDRQAMVLLNKEYKKCLKKAFRQYKVDFNVKLRNMKSENPKVYWQMLKDHRIEEKIPIESTEFYEHFKKLNSATIDVQEEADVLQRGSHETNDVLNRTFTTDEIRKCINKLKNNKAYGLDLILNEYIKVSVDMMLPVYVKLFNIILDTGVIPSNWLEGLIKPLYKNKGERNDCNNYRGITILSCFGKLFTAVLNERLGSFLESNNILGKEQAAFRKEHSTLDHIFAIQCLLDLYLSRKKRLYCCYVDYRKAFDSIERVRLWQKLLATNIDGRFFKLIFNLYKGAKSCVSNGRKANPSSFFNCDIGVRQGENLSPVLFSLFLNDLESFISGRCEGLEYLKEKMNEQLSDDELSGFVKLFMLLYADDTVLFADSPNDMQQALDAMFDYCNINKLSVNVGKTKMMVFSRGKIRNIPRFTFGEQVVEVVFSYKYLGVLFNYNASFVPNLKALSTVATKAMFALIQKGRNKFLDIDTLIHLFDCIVKPILLYGSEIWGYCNIDILERVQRRFLKIILKLNRNTPTNMVYGEVGCYPLSVSVKSRMISFWHKLVTTKKAKISSILYLFVYKLHCSNDNISKWLLFVKKVLDDAGLSFVWLNQGQNMSTEWLKQTLKQKLADQFVQEWHSEVDKSSTCINYRIFKNDFAFENYINVLPMKYRIIFSKFRCRNYKIPIVTGLYSNTPLEDRLCTLCNNDIGDEFHYIFNCTYFNAKRFVYLSQFYYQHPSTEKMSLLFNSKGDVLLNLCKFIEYVVKVVTPQN